MFTCTQCGDAAELGSGFYARPEAPLKPKQPCKRCQAKRTRKWRARSPEKTHAQNQRHWRRHKAALTAKNAAYQDSPKGRYRMYRKGAVGRGVAFELTFEQFMAFWQVPCGYCGSGIKTVGIDRTDNAIGYVLANCAPCCETCNFAKAGMTPADFVAHCRRVVEHASKVVP